MPHAFTPCPPNRGKANFHPQNGIYNDPLFGWVELVNNQGVIQMLGGALEYGGTGIIAGTQIVIQSVPEPGKLALAGLGLCYSAFGIVKDEAIKVSVPVLAGSSGREPAHANSSAGKGVRADARRRLPSLTNYLVATSCRTIWRSSARENGLPK